MSNEFRGLSKVFKFTLSQYIKTTAFKISLIIIVLASIVVFPILALNNPKEKTVKNKIETVYVINETSVNVDSATVKEAINKNSKYKDINVELIDKASQEEKEASIIESNAKAVIACIDRDEETGVYTIECSYDGDGKIKEKNVRDIAGILSKWFYDYKTESMALNDEVIEVLTDSITYKTYSEKEYKKIIGGVKDSAINGEGYAIVYFAIFISYMIIAISAGLISGKVAEEKTNRIVEYLMTNVRPMALITGKILAMLVVTAVNFALVVTCGFISNIISKALFNQGAKSIMGQYLSLDTLSQISAINIVLFVIILLLGIILYGTIAGLFAASVSKMEELQQGMKGYTMMLLAGFLLSYAALMVMSSKGFNSFVYFTMYFPLTSSMVMPGALFLGKAPLVSALICIAILAVTALLAIYFVSLVYENVIVANGEVITPKKMLELAKQSAKEKRSRRAANE